MKRIVKVVKIGQGNMRIGSCSHGSCSHARLLRHVKKSREFW
jgi:hypothetical protein